MKDRSPLYPGRVTLTPVSGQANTYDMARADQPTEAGTPLNKNTLLKDATAALYGLGSDAVPDEVLEMLKGSLKVEPGQVQTDKAFVNFNVGSGYQNVSEARALGYGDGTFGINKKVTALEAAAILERVININITLNENINVPYWAESGIALMIQKGIYNKNMNFNSGIDIYTADKIIKTNI